MALNLLFISMGLVFSLNICAQNTDLPTGKYTGVESPDFIVRIYKAQDGRYYGRDSLGNLVLDGLQFDAGDKAFKGTMTPSGKNVTLSAALSVEGADRLKMVVTKFLMSHTQYLTRIK